MSIFDKWNEMVDAKSLEKSIEELKENNDQDFEPVKHGKYEVYVDKIELKKCKSEKNIGLPMVSIWFKILEGEEKGRYIFYNRLFTTYDFLRHEIANLLGDLLNDEKAIGLINEVLREGKESKITDLLLDIHEEIDGKFEYLLDYGVNKKGYDTYIIEDVFDV